MERDPLLQEREKTHGNFRKTARIALTLKKICRVESGFSIQPWPDEFDHRQGEAMDMICTKIARILSGDNKCRDHWDDIAGYAKLGAEACD